jgi:isoleucyl-tRNA synthetase
VGLSAFYADVSKDRLYTFGVRSPERRSAQTAMYIMADGLTRLMAPILSFTADELWRFIPGTREESVHIAVFPKPEDLASLVDEDLTARWDALVTVRERVLAEIEPLRKNKQIGSSLQAKVVLTSGGPQLELLERHARHLPMLFIVSEVELRKSDDEGTLTVGIERAGGVKCERCWRYVPSVSSDPSLAGLCDRCQDALPRDGRAA